MDDLPYDPTDPTGFRRRAELAKQRSVQQGDRHAVAQKAEAATEDSRNGHQDGERASQPQTKRKMAISIHAPPNQQQKEAPWPHHFVYPEWLPAPEIARSREERSVHLKFRIRADHYFALRDIRREVVETAREQAARKDMEEEDGNLKRLRPGFW
ncbi:hypothetical protein DL764_004092 [Monosporascus ibericus]|uniref:Uncharacterized protein n=1 Tax=Monosporascus ibericus TaxID=155417 RepID=A0A4Q4THL7_9PEZI|nr:hypothetical protein DL764_004092 [Monosporascus ibericus]